MQTAGTWAAIFVAIGIAVWASQHTDSRETQATFREFTHELQSTIAKLQTDDALNTSKISDLQAANAATNAAVASLTAQLSTFNQSLQHISDQLTNYQQQQDRERVGRVR